MRLGIRQDEPSGGGRVVVAVDDPNLVMSRIVDGNPLKDDGAEIDIAALGVAGRHSILWSGSLADGLFAASPLNWMQPGRDALDRFCEAVTPGLEAAGATLCLHPHARHVLSDPPSCLRFLSDHAGEPLTVALAPSSLLEPSMLADQEDHLERIFEQLGPRCGLLILDDVTADEGGEACRPVPLGEGRLPREIVRSLIERFVPAEIDLVLPLGAVEPQLAWLGRL